MKLIDRAKNIIMTPKTEWAVIASEEPNGQSIFMSYALPLILASAAAAFIGHALFWGGHYGAYSFKWGLYFALQIVIMGAIGVWLTAAVINALAPSFSSEKSMGRAMQLVIYSMTPAWIGGLLMIFPPIGVIGMIFGIYGLYLMYLGLPHTMKTPQDKSVPYIVVSIIALIVIYAIIGWIFREIFFGMMGFGVLTTTPGMW
jgi:hypothetical protein